MLTDPTLEASLPDNFDGELVPLAEPEGDEVSGAEADDEADDDHACADDGIADGAGEPVNLLECNVSVLWLIIYGSEVAQQAIDLHRLARVTALPISELKTAWSTLSDFRCFYGCYNDGCSTLKTVALSTTLLCPKAVGELWSSQVPCADVLYVGR